MVSIPRLILLTAAAALLAAPVTADEKDDNGWEFRLQPHIWIPSLTADSSTGDVSTEVDTSASDVVTELEGAAVLNLEVRKDRLGVLVHGMYSKISADSPSPGPFFNLIDTTIELGMLDLALFARVLEGERGWVDLLLGGRYMHLGFDYDMQPDYAAIDEFTADLVDQTVDKIHAQVEDQINRVIDEIAAKVAALPAGEGAAAGRLIRSDVQTRAPLTTDEMVALVDRGLSPGRGSTPSYGNRRGAMGDALRAELSGRIERSTRKLANAIRAAVADGAQRRTERALSGLGPAPSAQEKSEVIQREIQDSTGARIDSIKQTASEQARKAIEEAEQELADALKEATTAVADADHAESREWIDPYIGLRGRWDMTRRLFAGARADIGGVGVGSDLTWQVFAGVGYEFNEHFDIELGWRYLSIDYEEDDFAFDGAFSGVTLGMGFTF